MALFPGDVTAFLYSHLVAFLLRDASASRLRFVGTLLLGNIPTNFSIFIVASLLRNLLATLLWNVGAGFFRNRVAFLLRDREAFLLRNTAAVLGDSILALLYRDIFTFFV